MGGIESLLSSKVSQQSVSLWVLMLFLLYHSVVLAGGFGKLKSRLWAVGILRNHSGLLGAQGFTMVFELWGTLRYHSEMQTIVALRCKSRVFAQKIWGAIVKVENGSPLVSNWVLDYRNPWYNSRVYMVGVPKMSSWSGVV